MSKQAVEFEVFQQVFYPGDYLCSGSGEPLVGICYCVGEVDDINGYHWRSFTERYWLDNIEGKLSPQEVYERYPEAGYDWSGGIDNE